MVLSVSGGTRAQAGDMKFQAQLVWATDDDKPPAGKDYKPVDSAIGGRLKKLLKWKNYFEVRHTEFALSPGEAKNVPISEKCQIEVKDVGKGTIEVVLVGKGKEVARQKQALPKGEMLVLGGNAPNATAWMVTLKRTD
jgi:hypothetical protein